MFIGALLLWLCELGKIPSAAIPNYSWSREKNPIPASYVCSCCRGKLHPQMGRIPLSGSNLTPIPTFKKKREIE